MYKQTEKRSSFLPYLLTYLQVHCPLGHEHELPQLQVHPGPGWLNQYDIMSCVGRIEGCLACRGERGRGGRIGMGWGRLLTHDEILVWL